MIKGNKMVGGGVLGEIFDGRLIPLFRLIYVVKLGYPKYIGYSEFLPNFSGWGVGSKHDLPDLGGSGIYQDIGVFGQTSPSTPHMVSKCPYGNIYRGNIYHGNIYRCNSTRYDNTYLR